MNEALSVHWKEARRHEAAGDIVAAKAAYEAMLAIEPMQVVPLLRLSRFAQVADRYVAAHAHAMQAGRVISATRTGKDAGFVTLRLLSFAEDAEVGRLILSLDWADPEVLKQAPVLAQHLWLVGKHAEALEFLTQACKKVRPNALLSHTRANVLRSLGKLREATEHYEYALQLSPHDPHVHRTLAYHQTARPTGSRVQRINVALTHHPSGSLEQAHLLHALFKELDDLGEIQGAWNALQEGAAIVRHNLRHDRQAEARQFERLSRQDLPASASRPDALEDQPTPIFIVGMPRTGTTLLDRVLGNHPDIVSVGERNDFDAAISEASDHFYQGGLQESEWQKLQGMDYAMAGQRYVDRVASLSGGSRFFIDKNPQNFFNIGLILRALPHARILCLQRDPMDACFSNLKEMFEGGAYPYSYALEDLAAHHRGFAALLRHWQSIAPDSVHVVRYEALIREGSDTLNEVLEFCGLEPVPGMLDITANSAPVSTASSSQVRSPIHDRSIGGWKRYAVQLEPLRTLLEPDAATST
jgi:tetratricopeptide (TPR) repeat protein